jgi:uncharacterized protein YbjT (DUF2867 family)
MKILLTGATGYIAKRLLPVLLNDGHEVFCCVRDASRFEASKYKSQKLKLVQADFLKPETFFNLPKDLDVAYYLIHSMSATAGDFEKLESTAAQNFVEYINSTHTRQVIYLSGIVNDTHLSKHLKSRKNVEDILQNGNYRLTTLRAGIIVGSGSASFEIIRDLVEKLPVMIAPRWLLTKSQPIAVRNVIQFLRGVLLFEPSFGKSFDIGGPEILTYKQMLLSFARVRGLRRSIFIVPVMTPRLSSYWLYFVTSTSYKLAINLVNSMKVEVIGKKNNLAELLNIELLSFKEAIQLAFDKIEQHEVISSWIDAQSSSILEKGVSELVAVPSFGCFKDQRMMKITDEARTLDKIWNIGGETGWYYGNWLWNLRGFIDKLFGGVGLRRGRRSAHEITSGDTLDFWRVIYANKEEKRLLLYAEMKLPGEAWLEFHVQGHELHQIATFRPLGLWGRLYWYLVLPFHGIIFKGMLNEITR